jgi:hypothetical protein
MLRLTQALERSAPPPRILFFRSLLSGVATGLGATVGVTLLLGLLGWTLNGLGYFKPLQPAVSAARKLLNVNPTPAPRR